MKPSHAKGAFASSYQRSFRRHNKNTPPSRPAMIYKPNPHKMDLKTTSGSAYLPYDLEVKQSQRPEAAKGVKFAANSMYKRDFPSWGALPIWHKKEGVFLYIQI